MKKTLIKALSSTIALTLVLASATVGAAPTAKIKADEIRPVKATEAVQEVKAEEKEIKEDGILAAIEEKVKAEAIAKVEEAEVPSVEIAKTAVAAEITAPKAEVKEETKAVPEIKVVPAAEAKAEAPAAETEAPEILEEEPAMEWDISATEFDSVAMAFYAEPVAAVNQVEVDKQNGIVTINGEGAMEEAVYRHFMSTEKFLATVKALFETEYKTQVDLVYDKDITDVIELDANIRYYSHETGERLLVTENIRANLNPADLLEFSPTEIHIAEGITNVSDYAFTCCEGLEEVVLPSTIETIGGAAFQYCKNLRKVVIPEKAEIAEGAFDFCNNLTDIQRVDETYYNGEAEPTMEWNISATEFDNVAMAFYAEPVAPVSQVEINRQNGVVYINGEGAMEENIYRHFMTVEKYIAATKALYEAEYGVEVDVKYDESITDVLELDSNICYYSHDTHEELYITDNMRSNLNPAEFIEFSPNAVYISDGITNVSDCAFIFCSDIREIVLPSTIEVIGKYAFQYCTSLTRVVLPENAEIKTGAFSRCSSLETVQLADEAFYNRLMAENAEDGAPVKTLTAEEINYLVSVE